jgi:regulator of replication initiation timing
MEAEGMDAKVTAMEQKVAAMETDIKEIKTDVKSMPEQIANRLNESIDMKIKLAISETEKKYQAKLIGLLMAIIGEGVGLVISFIK